MKLTQRIVIVGATSAIAEQCARRWAQQHAQQGSTEFVLLGRNLERLEAVAADLRVRDAHARCSTLSLDFTSPQEITAMADRLVAERLPDIVLIAHGTLPDQQQCQQNLDQAAQAININGLSPVLFAEAFVAHMEKANRGTIALIGSVAGDRGRKSNYVYGAAKGLVTRYAQGLQHRLAGTGVHVVLIKPGPTDTPMTAHLKQKGARLASADKVAATIVSGIEKGSPVIYAPGKWWLIMMIIRHLPRFVFNRMDI